MSPGGKARDGSREALDFREDIEIGEEETSIAHRKEFGERHGSPDLWISGALSRSVASYDQSAGAPLGIPRLACAAAIVRAATGFNRNKAMSAASTEQPIMAQKMPTQLTSRNAEHTYSLSPARPNSST